MKKIVKIILIVIMCFVIAYAIKIAIGFWIWYNISSEDQLKVTQSSYEKCMAEGGDSCDSLFARGLKHSLETRQTEDMEVVLDKSRSEEERIKALEHFYLYADDRQGEMINQEIMDFYYIVVYDEENPLDLSLKALEYLLSHPTQDEKIIETQRQVAQDNEYTSDFRKAAVRSLARMGYEEDKDMFYQMLIDENSPARFWANQGLISTEAIDKMPDLLEVALDESKSVSIRSQALATMKELILKAGAEKDMNMVEKLELLLEHQSVAIWAGADDLLEVLTGKSYKGNKLTEEEATEYMSNLLENTFNEEEIFPENER